MITEDNATGMAQSNPSGAYEFDGAYFHSNECTFASRPRDSDCTVACVGLGDRDGCGYEKPITELQRDGVGYFVVPAFCPRCWLAGDVSGVRTRNPNAKQVVPE